MADDLAWLDATAQAALVRTGELTPLELVDAAINRIEKLNGELNAVIIPLFEQARERAQSADLPDGPFRGVPFLLKDLGECEAGMPQYAGNRALKEIDHHVSEDTALGARFREAGFITLGKTNTPEFGIQATTQPLAFGPTRNPWDVTRSPNGSSGGSAAAVAAGMVPVAHANDGGGSIRMPAAWCGLVGLKPSRGRTPLRDENGAARNLVEHVVSRSVRDTAAILDAVHGARPWDLFHAPPPARAFVDEVGADPGRLRIGILTASPLGEVHAACVAATEAAGRLLESLGHAVEPSWPEALFEGSGDLMAEIDLMAATTRLMIEQLEDTLGRPVEERDVEPFVWSSRMPERVPTAEQAMAVPSRLHLRAVSIQRWWADGGFDLLLTPTVYEPPAPLTELVPPDDLPAKFGFRVARTCGFAQPYNLTGQPAISLPLSWTDDGLPVGVQLVAAYGREDVLLRVASQLEAAQPWADRRPPVSA